MREYYLKNNGRIKGPFMLDDLKHQNINSSTLVKTEKDGEWVSIEEDGDLHFLVKVKSNYRITEHNERRHSVSKKPKSLIMIVALILMLLIGLGMYFFIGLQPQL